ncbi:MAG: trigger factor [Micavibrio aeruginosavorus]|uniref:Trigger factor n=1 Tax=Micavibrio aeruginosavorus TaxID=349221 RepID=A0A2W5MWI7_9BACT|nr:MAG: trigger factor [Micavibrio aeruginosavorus]
MQVKDIKSEGLKVEIEVTVPANDIKKKQEVKLKEVGKTAKLPGFRPGKVPMKMLEQKYGRAVMGEVLELVVNDATAKVLKDKNIRPAMQPKIEVKEFDEGKDLVFNMQLETLPKVEVMDLKGLKLTRPVAKMDAKSIDETLERIASNNRTTQPVEGRATKKGDIAVITFHGRTADDNVQHEGMHAHGVELELGSGRFIPGFEDQLIGKNAGETIEVKVTFPADYGAAELAGRDAIFDTVIEAINEAAPAKVDDELAKKLGMEDEKALRAAVEQQMNAEYENHSRMKLKRQLLDILDEKHDFEIPEGMVSAEYDGILKQIEQERAANPAENGPTLSDEEKEELQLIAQRRVRLGLILSEVGTANKVTVNDKEIQRAVIAEAQKYPGYEKQVFEYYQKNRGALDMLRAPIFEEKVVELIFKDAAITDKEVSIEELTKEEDDIELKGAKKKEKAEKKPAAKKTKKDE